MAKKPKCPGGDCFKCPLPDCVINTEQLRRDKSIDESALMKSLFCLSKEEKKRRRIETNKKHYQKKKRQSRLSGVGSSETPAI